MNEERFDYWQEQIRGAPWNLGNVAEGRRVFAERKCADCHGGGVNLGPDLSGATDRHTPVGLMRTILYPHLDVAERYSVRKIVTNSGETYTGVILFESPQTIILQTEDGNTVRLRHTEIQQRIATHQTIMPLGLMKRATGRDLADLYAYLKTLN